MIIEQPDTLRSLEKRLKQILEGNPVQVDFELSNDRRGYTLSYRGGDNHKHKITALLANPPTGYQLLGISKRINSPYFASVSNNGTRLTIVHE